MIYVTGDVAGSIESPVYAILAMNRALDTLRVDGASIRRYNAVQPDRLDETAIKWDGEWQVTIEVFRDLGLAFAAVLVLIYVLVVGWFQSFTSPAGHHGADPAHPDRHPAGSRPDRRLLHRHLA